ncbi:MAG: hypothetical protein LBS16_03125 [Prevotellaceae bacterium]|jgi:hypothetical protein|nr:hypothetical protein [Prevotellaceae bacterium]
MSETLRSCDNKIEHNFSVPDGYFEQFARRMDLCIAASEKSLRRRVRPFLYAAVFAGVALIGAWWLTADSFSLDAGQAASRYNEYSDQVLDEISEDVLVEYILANAN